MSKDSFMAKTTTLKEKTLLPKSFGPEKVIFENNYKKFYSVQAEFEGFSKEYFVTECGERGAIMVVDGDKVLLVRQYRFLINDFSWEFPGGAIREGETPEEAVIRELREETGIMAKRPRLLMAYHLTLDTVDNFTRIYLTEEFEVVEENPLNPREVIGHAWVPFDQCLDMVFSGELRDSMTIIGLLNYWAKGKPL